MSSLFYDYISSKIITFFQTNAPKSGDKFYIQFDSDEQVECLFNELKENVLANPFSYVDNDRNQQYDTYELNFGDVQLIVCASINQIPHPDFLATIRNLVGVSEGYENKACLSIFASEPDSILGGAGSLAKEGMPLNVTFIERDISRMIAEKGYSEQDKAILDFYLLNKSQELEWETATSLFEYEELIECLNESYISEAKYKSFELFYDDQLFFYNEKQLKEAIRDNHNHFVEISEIHNYGPDETRLERLYGEEGAKALMASDWQNIKYSDIKKFIEKKKKENVVEYFPIIGDPKVWDKEEGTSKAKSRTRNIICFLDPAKTEMEVSLSFSEFTKSEYINIPSEFQSSVECVNSGKKLNVKLTSIEDKAAFYRIKYNANGVVFDFKFVALRCQPSIIESIKTQYTIEIRKPETSAIRINSDDDVVVFNEYYDQNKSEVINESESCITIPNETRVTISIGEDYPYAEDNDDVRFVISTNGFIIPVIKAFVVDKPTNIEGVKLWYLKNAKQSNFIVGGENSFLFGTKKYSTRNEFKRYIELELKYIELGSPFAIEKYDGLEAVDISLPVEVRDAFNKIIEFFKSNNSIPSLAYVNPELRSLYENYIKAILVAIDSIPENAYLTEEIKGIFKLGMIKRQIEDKELLLSPLHPINISYQLFIAEQNIAGLDDETKLLKQFQQSSLLPYINVDPYTNENRVYIPIEQSHNPEWKVYVDENLPRYKGSKDFVSKLVPDKIREFADHFSYLFPNNSGAPIKINLINTGDCKEIVQGIINYYIGELRRNNSKQVLPMKVTLYTDAVIDTAFEKVSKIEDIDELMDIFDLHDVHIGNIGLDDIIDIYRRNVDFYIRDTQKFEYSHITFIELANNNQPITTEMSDIPSGIVMNGIASSVPSEMLGDTYRTGFGTKYVERDSELIRLCVGLNALNAAINGDSYRRNACCASRMGVGEHSLLERVYDASNWVTFINPKVDLNFFKTDSGSSDLMIINYSDQYSLSGYDAITVTKKSKQYQDAISRYLTTNGVENTDVYSKDIINIFNAINGDWLIRMLSKKNQFPVEKLSILSAMKLAVASFSNQGVIWIPISLEEILRVSGSVGLSKSDSIFSTKNLGFEGSTSDDILLVGIKEGNPVQVSYYPIEVKIGKIEPGYLAKGINQALHTRQIFDEVLEKGDCKSKSIKTRLFRNFFIQQVLVNAGKLLLFDVGNGEQGWEKITSSDLRTKLVSEEYIVVDSFFDDIGKAGVVSFRNDCTSDKLLRNQDVLIIEQSKTKGINLLATDFSNIPLIPLNAVEECSDLSTVIENDQPPVSNEETTVSSEDSIDTNSSQENPIVVSNTEFTHTRVLIGEDKYNREIYWEFGHKELANRHVLITGTSGQGKTYAIQTMLYELTVKNVPSIIFDYTEGFKMAQLDESFKERLTDKIEQRIIYNTGVPINPFIQHEIDIDGEIILERPADVASRLSDIFVHVYKFGSQQSSAIFTAALNGIKKYGKGMNMELFQKELEEVAEENKAANTVISKLSPFFHTVDFNSDPSFDWGRILYSDNAKVNIMQLTIFSSEMQVAIIEMMLWDLWYYASKHGSKDKPFVVVLDEAQNLSHENKSPSAKILTEGRKFGWSAWFATQSLRVFSEDVIIRLMQPALKMYFKPTEIEMDKIVKQLNNINSSINWNEELQRLKTCLCIFVGDKMLPDGTFAKLTPIVTSISSFEKRN